MPVVSAMATPRARASRAPSTRSRIAIRAGPGRARRAALPRSSQRDHRLDDGRIDRLALRLPDRLAGLLPLGFLARARRVDLHLGLAQPLLEGALALAVDLVRLVGGLPGGGHEGLLDVRRHRVPG